MTSKNRISIFYGGLEYAVSGRSFDDVAAEVESGSASGVPTWLEVRIGQGRSTPARLLLGPGIPVALAEVNVDGGPAPRDDEHAKDSPAAAPAADVP